MYQVRLPNNPFSGKVTHEEKSTDEQDYESYLKSERERRDDPTWDPVMFDDGTSTQDWSNSRR
jgi:hypothetical protein